MNWTETILYALAAFFISSFIDTLLQIWKARLLLKIQVARNNRYKIAMMANHKKADYKMISRNGKFEDKGSIGLN